MRTRPPEEELADDDLREAMAAGWRLDVDDVVYLPVGFGSHHWSAVDRAGTRWFVTVDDLVAKRHRPDEPVDVVFGRLRDALQTAVDLRHEVGLAFVVAPVPTTTAGEPLLRFGGQHRSRWAASLFPHLDGETADFDGPADDVVLQHLAELHRTDPARTPTIGTEDFEVPNRAPFLETMRRLDDDDRPRDAGPHAEAARTLLRTHGERVRRSFDRYDELVAAERRRPARRVVTHGEPHPANVLVTPEGERLLIDWDTAMLAPPERDLRHAGRGRHGDPDVLELYRRRWALEEVAGYALALHAPHEATEDTALFLEGLEEYLLDE